MDYVTVRRLFFKSCGLLKITGFETTSVEDVQSRPVSVNKLLDDGHILGEVSSAPRPPLHT